MNKYWKQHHNFETNLSLSACYDGILDPQTLENITK